MQSCDMRRWCRKSTSKGIGIDFNRWTSMTCCWVRKAVCGELIIFRSAINKALSHFVVFTFGVRYHRRHSWHAVANCFTIYKSSRERERYNWCEAPKKISCAALHSTAHKAHLGVSISWQIVSSTAVSEKTTILVV